MSTEARVIEVVQQQLGGYSNGHEVVATTAIKEDMNADSLDFIELNMAIEEEFEIEIPDDDWYPVESVEDIVRVVDSLLKVN